MALPPWNTGLLEVPPFARGDHRMALQLTITMREGGFKPGGGGTAASESGRRWLMATLNREGCQFDTQMVGLGQEDFLLHWRWLGEVFRF